MAITLANINNSGNLVNSSGRTVSYTTTSNTKGLAVIITGADSVAADAIANVTFNGDSLTELRRYRMSNYQVSIFYKELPYIGTANLVVTMGGANTDLQVTTVCLESTSTSIVPHTYAQGSGSTTSQTLVIDATGGMTNSIALGGIVFINAAITALSVSAGTEIAGSEADMGSQVVGCAYAYQSGTTTTITWAKSSATASYALMYTFVEYEKPIVTLNTPTNNSTNVPTQYVEFKFTGASSSNIDLEYNLVIKKTSDDSTIIDAYSTTHPFFFRTGDTHPFTSGQEVTYTLSVTLLNDTSYYWYVRAGYLDVWGDFSETRTFTTYPIPAVTLNNPTNNATKVALQPELKFTGTIATNEDLSYELSLTQIIEEELSNLTPTVLNLSSGENINYALVVDDNFLYATLATSPSVLLRVRKSDFSERLTTVFPTGANNAYCMCQDSSYVYVGCAGVSPGKVVRVSKSDMSVTVFTCQTGENDIRAITTYGGWIYAICNTAPTKIVRIDDYDFTSYKTLPVPDMSNVWACTVDSDFLYLGEYKATSPRVGRVYLEDFTYYTELSCTYVECSYSYIARSMTNDSNYVYFGFGGNTVCGRLDKSQFTIDYLQLPQQQIYSVAQNDKYVFFGSANSSVIMVIDKATFTFVDSLTLPSTKLYGLCDDGYSLFAGLDSSPAKLYRIDYKYIISDTYDSITLPDLFTRTGDTEPFTSGQEVTFIPPIALATSSICNWKVRAKATTGANVWGNWSTLYMFTTKGAPWTDVVRLKYWDGSSWVEKPLKYWNGAGWTEKQIKRY